eukprot:6181789-Pleurochrysis_carterae.AAC.1
MPTTKRVRKLTQLHASREARARASWSQERRCVTSRCTDPLTATQYLKKEKAATVGAWTATYTRTDAPPLHEDL